MATLGLVPPVRSPLLPGEEEDPNAMPGAAPPVLNAVEPGQGAGGGSPTLQVVAPPATVDTTLTKGAQTNTTTTETTPEIDKGLDTHTSAVARAAEASATMAAENEKLAKQAADAADQKAALATQLAAQRAQKVAEENARVEAAMGEERQRRKEMDAASTMHSFWGPENRGAPARIFANVMSALADYSHLKAGGQGPSVASQYIEQEIAKDRQQKIDAFTRAKDFQQLAAHDVDQARDLLTDHLKQFDAEGQVQRDKLTAMLEAQLARSRIPFAAAEAQKLRAESDAKNAESDVKLRETFAAKVAKEGARRDVTHVDNTATGGGGAEKGKSDWTVFDENGKPTRRGRSFEEANPLRDQYAALQSAAAVAGRLAALNEERGRLPSLKVEQTIDTTIGNLIEKKKALLGALTESDENRIKAKLKAGMLGGAESANAAIGEFMQGMKDDYRTKMEAHSVPNAEDAPAPAAKPVAPKTMPKPGPRDASSAADVAAAKRFLRDNPNAPAGQRARIEAWIQAH